MKTAVLALGAVAFGIAFLSGCSSSSSSPSPSNTDGGPSANPSGDDDGGAKTDDDGGASADGSTPPSGRCNPSKPFAPFVEVSEFPSFLGGDPWLTPDELTIVFDAETANFKLELRSATRSSITGTFGTPIVLTIPNANGMEATPDLSSDGLTLTFARGETGNPFHRATRTSTTSPFLNDVQVPVAAPTPRKGVRLPRVVPSGALYYQGIYDATDAVYRDAPGGGSTAIALADSGDFFGLFVSADEKTLYVSGTGSDNRLVAARATRTNIGSPFPAVTLVSELVAPADTNGFDLAWVSSDDCVAYGTVSRTANSMAKIVRATRGR